METSSSTTPRTGSYPFFWLWAKLPPTRGYLMWNAAKIACVFLAARTFGGNTVLAVLSYRMFYALFLGQITGILVGGLALAWWALAHRRWQIARLALLVASAAGTTRIFVDPNLAREDCRTAAAIVSEDRMPDDLVILRNAEDIIPVTYSHRPDLDPWTHLQPREELDPWSAIITENGPHRLWLVYVNPSVLTTC